QQLVQLPRTFPKAMGIALAGHKMAVACLDEVLVLVNSPALAWHYPKNPGTYDALFMPRAAYFTGQLDIHDLDWGSGGELFAVNTSFSCIIKIDENYSFTPVWKPPFISKIASEDRCHLNGMAFLDGKPKFATAFNAGDSPQSWRQEVTTGGIVMDVESGEIIARNLPMPHSPRLHDGRFFVLLSATGELVEVDVNSGKYEVVAQPGGFVRGLAFIGEYAFIGWSRLRKSSATFSQLPFSEKADKAGVAVVHLPSGRLVGEIVYHHSVEEIYDVQIIPGCVRPGILNTQKPEHKLGLATPETTWWASPELAQS
ncbi:MAG: TIGR03032 family protein, partial [Bacteroidota bacterium]